MPASSYRSSLEIVNAYKAGQLTAEQATQEIANLISGGAPVTYGISQQAVQVFNQLTGGGGTTAGLLATPQPTAEALTNYQKLGEEEPFAAYLKRYALPGYGQAPTQAWQSRQFAPAYATYQAGSALNPKTATPDWTTYMSGQPAGDVSSRQQASQLFTQALGQTPQEQRSFQEQLGGMGGDFGDFLKNILAGQYAAPVARRMGAWLPGMEQQFLAESTGAPEASFLSFLKNRLRL